jgi:protein gp37
LSEFPVPTKIEWTDETWNPVTGCVKVSPGCRHCYAEMIAGQRFGGTRTFPTGFRPHLRPDKLDVPRRWRRPRMVFVNSMSDLFGEFVPDEHVERVFTVMRETPGHIYQVLTKRAARMRSWARRHPWVENTSNIWLGVSVEDRKHGLPRVEALRGTVAALRFLSIEPLLEDLGSVDLTGIDWVIVGGESGPHARPMDAAWVRPIRAACVAATVPFFFKQWGGKNKKQAGRLLDGRTWDQFPALGRAR